MCSLTSSLHLWSHNLDYNFPCTHYSLHLDDSYSLYKPQLRYHCTICSRLYYFSYCFNSEFVFLENRDGVFSPISLKGLKWFFNLICGFEYKIISSLQSLPLQPPVSLPPLHLHGFVCCQWPVEGTLAFDWCTLLKTFDSFSIKLAFILFEFFNQKTKIMH